MIAKNIFRVMVIAFFGMTWSFVLMPALEMAGIRLTTFDKLVSYIVAPLAGLIAAQLLLRGLRDDR